MVNGSDLLPLNTSMVVTPVPPRHQVVGYKFPPRNLPGCVTVISQLVSGRLDPPTWGLNQTSESTALTTRLFFKQGQYLCANKVERKDIYNL